MWALTGLIVAYRVAAEAALRVIEYRPSGSHLGLRDVSATIQQLDLRLQQACYWPLQYITLRRQKHDLARLREFHPEYIRFYNSMWLVANDIIIGATIGTYLIENKQAIVRFVEFCIRDLLTAGLADTIAWLMDWPGGLKLNNELAAFFGELFLWVIHFWGSALGHLQPYLPILVHVIGLSGFLGATFAFALIADLTSLLTLQIYSCYLSAARIYNWQVTVLSSLFHLFRGKRRNVLRQRIDSCDYGFDQLLVGTILFTVLIFLLPTVAVFYAFFAGARFGIILSNAFLESCVMLLNHFPLFAIMLRLKDPRRVPGGVRIDLVDRPARDGVYLTLTPLALPVMAMFQPYFVLCRQIQQHYLSANMLGLLVGGGLVPIRGSHLYSLQYSMLPSERIPTRTLSAEILRFAKERTRGK
ncbi:N-acetylglucosaminyl transferase component-domain-containing protein [Dipodascopsis tothii]|uniref:N-acetylglucosaminyl transferase component-domain-containing protein n=1 Tax=Dipodascopsis tothii TaxID=44089 RepID=UPI0034CD2D8A